MMDTFNILNKKFKQLKNKINFFKTFIKKIKKYIQNKTNEKTRKKKSLPKNLYMKPPV